MECTPVLYVCVLVFSMIRTTGRRRSVVTVTPSPGSANADAKPVTGTRRYSTAAAQFPGTSHTLGAVRRQSVAVAGNRSATLGGRRMSAYSRRDALQDLNEEEQFEKSEEDGERKRKSSLEGIKGLLRSSAKKTLGRRRRRSSGEGLGEKQSSGNSQDTVEEFENISRSISDTRYDIPFYAWCASTPAQQLLVYSLRSWHHTLPNRLRSQASCLHSMCEV